MAESIASEGAPYVPAGRHGAFGGVVGGLFYMWGGCGYSVYGMSAYYVSALGCMV